MVSVCVLPVKFASNIACCCPFEAANTAVFYTYYNVNAPGENFGSHRGRFFVFSQRFLIALPQSEGVRYPEQLMSARGLGQAASTFRCAEWVSVGIACRLLFTLCFRHLESGSSFIFP